MNRNVLRYAKSVGWLLVPVFAWNVVLSPRLPPAFSPAVFSFNISPRLLAIENTLRIVVFAFPFFAPFELRTTAQKVGLAFFAGGTMIYFSSWIPLITDPSSSWSRSAAGFLAPAYTPLIWLIGLALLMPRLHWRSLYRWWLYLALSIGFLSAHISHATIVFGRISHHGGG